MQTAGAPAGRSESEPEIHGPADRRATAAILLWRYAVIAMTRTRPS